MPALLCRTSSAADWTLVILGTPYE
jgi:hypothetical protein